MAAIRIQAEGFQMWARPSQLPCPTGLTELTPDFPALYSSKGTIRGLRDQATRTLHIPSIIYMYESHVIKMEINLSYMLESRHQILLSLLRHDANPHFPSHSPSHSHTHSHPHPHPSYFYFHSHFIQQMMDNLSARGTT